MQKPPNPFYTGLFGWKLDTMNVGEGGPYTFFVNADKGFGGIVQTDPAHGIPPHWSSYLEAVPTVDEACEQILAVGGSVLQPGMDIPGIGRMAFAIDPQGARINPFKSAPSDATPPSGYSGAKGGISWVELMATDPTAAVAFYCSLTGWTSYDIDMGTGPYTVMQDGDVMLAGIMALPDGVTQPAWMIYFGIVQETMEEVLVELKRFGGQDGMGPMEIPTVGTIAAVADSTGAWFNLMRSSD